MAPDSHLLSEPLPEESQQKSSDWLPAASALCGEAYREEQCPSDSLAAVEGFHKPGGYQVEPWRQRCRWVGWDCSRPLECEGAVAAMQSLSCSRNAWGGGVP